MVAILCFENTVLQCTGKCKNLHRLRQASRARALAHSASLGAAAGGLRWIASRRHCATKGNVRCAGGRAAGLGALAEALQHTTSLQSFTLELSGTRATDETSIVAQRMVFTYE